MKILKSFYLSRVSQEVAIVLFLLKPVNKLRYIFIPDLGQRLTIATQYRLCACSELKAEAFINK